MPQVKPMARISLPGNPPESVWATRVGENLYRVENIPFFAEDVHFQDIVKCSPQALHTLPIMQEMYQYSGNSTLSMQVKRGINHEHHPLFKKLAAMGVTGEGAAGVMWAMNVPVTVNKLELKRILNEEPDVAGYEIYSPLNA